MNEAKGNNATQGNILLAEAIRRKKALKESYDRKQNIDFRSGIKSIYDVLLSAYEILKHCPGADRKSAQCKSEVAWCLINMGQHKEAIDCCREALDAFQLLEHSIFDQASCKELIAQAYFRLGMGEEGTRWGTEATELLARKDQIMEEIEWKAKFDPDTYA